MHSLSECGCLILLSQESYNCEVKFLNSLDINLNIHGASETIISNEIQIFELIYDDNKVDFILQWKILFAMP